MTILVTGAAGFIGFHVANALLDRGETVLGLDNLNRYYDPKLKAGRLEQLERRQGFRFVYADIGRFQALEAAAYNDMPKIDRIVHLAAQAGVRHSIDHPQDYLQSNYAGHLNILELARRLSNLKHLVYASSSSVYGGSTAIPFALDNPVDRPTSLYAASKRANELASISYASLYRIPQTGLRFFTVYGPWGRPDMAYYRFTADILAGRPIPVYGDGTQSRDFTYVEDIVAGVVGALDRPPISNTAPHRLFNLGNDKPNTLNRLIELIEDACGKKAVRDVKPVQPADVPATWADISESRRELDFTPRTALEDGIPRFVDWYRGFAKD
ncbi:NAD-dependent epimerase/dehydratase family protein [Dongia sedimenti]|uniref:NAD-dependent epimerase/dehydratase family protein n=1 Tax=Dongia sedimenti TaxID=3064282 RepID=A0ABU0YG13_9PROT|nr:NAD-dependent epimerase/dehydratase family protein [Rhodospirillaceae bacterium R-7]